MTTTATNSQFQFPHRNYSKYRSQSKTNPLFNKLNGDTGYPQEMFASISSIASHKNYLKDNKKNLKNFFAERLPPRNSSIYRQSESIDPSRIFQIKRKQYELKNQTKIMLNKTIDIESAPFRVEPQKISQIFLVNDKNLELKKKFQEQGGTRIAQPYQSINFRRGTQSYLRKCSNITKKDAYNSVFGPDVSSTTHKKMNKTTKDWLSYRQSKNVSSVGRKTNRTSMDDRKKQKEKKRFSSLIEGVDNYRQKLDPDNRMAIKPYQAPIEEEDKDNERNLMLTWIRDVAKGYKNNSVNMNLQKLRRLQDIVKMDKNYYDKMVEHKNKRLQVRSMLFVHGQNVRQFNNEMEMNESGMDIMREILDNIQKGAEMQQNISISGIESDESNISSQQCDEILVENVRMSVMQRFQKFGNILVFTLYRANFYGIQNKQSIYNAFWKKPVPFQKSGSYAFFKAIKKGDLNGIKKFIDADPLYIYERDHKGRSPLIYACINNHTQVIKYILTKQINIDHRCFRRRTALYYALQHQNEQNIRMLLHGGADVWSTAYNPIGQICAKNQNPRIRTLIKNGRKIWIAIGLQANRLKKLQYWKNNKHLICSDKVICF